ncbi:MAG: methyltransferase domain-containing protein [Chloroflexi bacterium]|nr:methyltransferase domain-containing protein [Chloroflexota bacterium]
MNEHAAVAACCTELYGHPLASTLMGLSFHPGGLRLTEKLATLAGVGPDSLVLDAGSGNGVSAVHLAKTHGCAVVGVTLEPQGVQAGRVLAQRSGVAGQVEFLQSDVAKNDLPADHFDVVLMECVLSSIHNKARMVDRLCRSLKPGGRLALSDVTRNGSLPGEWAGPVMSALCLNDALGLDEYARLFENAGLTVEASDQEDLVVSQFIQGVRGALLVAEVAAKLGKLGVDVRHISTAKRILDDVDGLVRGGVLGYGVVVAKKGTLWNLHESSNQPTTGEKNNGAQADSERQTSPHQP